MLRNGKLNPKKWGKWEKSEKMGKIGEKDRGRKKSIVIITFNQLITSVTHLDMEGKRSKR